MNKTFARFARYSLVGFSTFVLDLVVLYVLTEGAKVHYLFATAIAFIIAITVNYHFSRRYVFSTTARGMRSGYYIFILISSSGLVIVVGLMALIVETTDIAFTLARILIAGIVGFYNYLANLFLNFKVAGLHANIDS